MSWFRSVALMKQTHQSLSYSNYLSLSFQMKKHLALNSNSKLRKQSHNNNSNNHLHITNPKRKRSYMTTQTLKDTQRRREISLMITRTMNCKVSGLKLTHHPQRRKIKDTRRMIHQTHMRMSLRMRSKRICQMITISWNLMIILEPVAIG